MWADMFCTMSSPDIRMAPQHDSLKARFNREPFLSVRNLVSDPVSL